MDNGEKNRMMQGATRTRDQKDVPKKTRPANEDIGQAPGETAKPEPAAAKE